MGSPMYLENKMPNRKYVECMGSVWNLCWRGNLGRFSKVHHQEPCP